jgi:hypothetical protein
MCNVDRRLINTADMKNNAVKQARPWQHFHNPVKTTAKIANPEIANAEVFTDIEAAEGK